MKVLKSTIVVVILLAIIYIAGPRAEAPDLSTFSKTFPSDLIELEDFIQKKEQSIENLKFNNESRFIWADSIPHKTEWSIVYLHGFSASPEEGNGIHEILAKRYRANLFVPRLFAHGIERGDDNMVELKADSLLQSAAEAIQVGKIIGENVLVVSCSTGSTLSLILASNDPEIDGLINYSPNIDVFDKSAGLLTKPWGLQLAKLLEGDEHRSFVPANEHQNEYWTCRYRYEAIVEMMLLLEHGMTTENFLNIKQPVLNSYWERDSVISVSRILEMHQELGSSKKSIINFPNAGSHMMVSSVFSEDLLNIQHKTFEFLESELDMQPF